MMDLLLQWDGADESERLCSVASYNIRPDHMLEVYYSCGATEYFSTRRMSRIRPVEVGTDKPYVPPKPTRRRAYSSEVMDLSNTAEEEDLPEGYTDHDLLIDEEIFFHIGHGDTLTIRKHEDGFQVGIVGSEHTEQYSPERLRGLIDKMTDFPYTATREKLEKVDTLFTQVTGCKTGAPWAKTEGSVFMVDEQCIREGEIKSVRSGTYKLENGVLYKHGMDSKWYEVDWNKHD